MLHAPVPVFSFDEPDHLTRIHLKIALEDVGFTIAEQAGAIVVLQAKLDGSRNNQAGPLCATKLRCNDEF